MGFLCVFIPHLILWFMFPDSLDGDVPRWMCLFIGVMHLVYMNFDNLDGKQARKTGNSSPMGLLFDHGCDAMIVNIQGISLATCMGFGNNYLGYLVYGSGAIPFFITTLEEYYTDIMYLPIINGAAEGCFAVGFFILMSAFLGPESWSQELIFGLKRREVTLILTLAAGFVTCLNIIYAKKGMKILKEAIWNTGFTFFIHGVVTYIFFFSPTNVASTHTRLLMYISGLHWCKSCSILQMCHVSRSEYNQFRKATFILLVPLLLNTVLGNIFGSCPVDEVLMIKIVLFLSIFVYCHMVWFSINQFCSALNIRTFHVKPIKGDDAKAKTN